MTVSIDTFAARAALSLGIRELARAGWVPKSESVPIGTPILRLVRTPDSIEAEHALECSGGSA